MSASTTTVPASTIEYGGTMDARGYVYCLDCDPRDAVHRPFGPDAQWIEVRNMADDDVCHRCHGSFLDCTPLEIIGTTTVEYPRCKIF